MVALVTYPLLIVFQGDLDVIHLLGQLQECATSADHNTLLHRSLQGRDSHIWSCASIAASPAHMHA